MKSYVFKIIAKHLLLNKKRSITTIIGITLSSVLIFSIVLLAGSYRDFTISNEYQQSGDYHFIIEDYDIDELDELGSYVDTTNLAMTNYAGSDTLGNQMMIQYNSYAYETLGVILSSGDFPEALNEVIVSNYYAYVYLDNDPLNKTIKIIENGSEYEYVVVGVSNNINQIIGNINQQDMITANIYFKVDNPRNTESITSLIIENTDTEETNIIYNEQVLRYFGFESSTTGNTSVITIFALIIGLVIVITSFVMIYTSFTLSLNERKKEYGILKSVGATNGQIKQIIVSEALVLSTIAIPLGFLVSSLGLMVLKGKINNIIHVVTLTGGNTLPLEISFNLLYILLCIVFIVVVVLISVIIPSIKATKVSPISVIRQNGDIKRVKKSDFWLIRKMFGYNGVYVKKNINRNKRRFLITNISLTVSLLIFIASNSAFIYSRQIIESNFDDYSYNVSTTGSTDSFDDLNESILPGIDYDFSVSTNRDFELQNGCDLITEEFRSINSVEDRCSIYVNIIYLSEDNLLTYLTGIELEKLEQGEAIYISNEIRDNEANFYNYDIITSKESDTVTFSKYIDSETQYERSLLITKKTDVIPNATYLYDSTTINLLVSEETFVSIIDDAKVIEGYHTYSLYVDSLNVDETVELLQNYDHNGYTYNHYKEQQESIMLIDIMKYIGYAFILLVSFISISNVFNILTSNQAQKRREYAMVMSIGSSLKDVKRMILYEGVLYTINAFIYSGIVGVGLSYTFYFVLKNSYNVQPVVPFNGILSALSLLVILTGVTYVFSVKNTSKSSLIETIRNVNV